VIPSVAAAQGTSVAEQRARVAVLNRRAVFIVAADARADSVRSRAQSFDTAQAGPLTVLTQVAHRGVVHSGTALAWQRLAPLFGADSGLLTHDWYFAWANGDAYGGNVFLRGGERRGHYLLRGLWAPIVDGPDAAAGVARNIVKAVAASLADTAGAPFAKWLGTSMPILSDSAELTAIYVALVTARAQVARRCFTGDLASCRQALELDAATDPTTAWYDPAGRRSVVAEYMAQHREVPAGDDCLAPGGDESCIRFIRSWQYLPRPLNNAVRASFTRTALSLGGKGSYGRLVGARGSVADRLAAAGGMQLDTLVARWRADVLASRPPSLAVRARTQWSTIFWVIVCATLALRSSRWRSE
jgi:hypothetical protein